MEFEEVHRKWASSLNWCHEPQCWWKGSRPPACAANTRCVLCVHMVCIPTYRYKKIMYSIFQVVIKQRRWIGQLKFSNLTSKVTSQLSMYSGTLITLKITSIMYLYTTVDGNADALVSEPGSISKQLFPARVREMHHNRDEGFEREFGVRLLHLSSWLCTCNDHFCNIFRLLDLEH